MDHIPETEGPKRIRALDRGLAIVELLSRQGLTSLAQLRAATGLSNATLLRILATLQDRGWVRRNIVEGQYELAHSLGDLLGENARAQPLAELAAPILLDLRPRQLGLPSDLSTVRAPGRIEIIESTRLRGPMAPARTALGLRPSLVFSAHGRALLAFAPDAERQIHLGAAMKTATKEERRWMSDGSLDKELSQTRARGYGLRERDYYITSGFEPGPDLGAIAVPILSASGIHGTLSLLWLRDDMSLAEVLDLDSLIALRRASARIGSALDRNGHAAPRFSEQNA